MTKVITIDEKSNYLTMVIELGDANSKTLGFLKKSAFREFATRKQIFVAVNEHDEFLGYLLYATNQRKLEASIVHLCVKDSQKRQGIAQILFEELKEKTKEFFRIRVHCRRDFKVASQVWPKLGFVVRGEISGRSKQGSTLTVWWFEHGHPTLFAQASEQHSRAKLWVAIDANIFYELQTPPKTENEKESHSLLADWLNVELCLTPEIYNEINRSKDMVKRKQGWNMADTAFQMLSSSEDDFQTSYAQLRNFFPANMNDSDESDLRQLAWSIAANVQFFVTHDKALLNKDEKIYNRFGMHLIEPSYLIIHQDELMKENEYQPVRLAGRINIKRVQDEQISLLEQTFTRKTKSEFKRLLRPCLSDPRTFDTKIIQQSSGQPLALVSYGRSTQYELEIPVFRLSPNSLSATLARFLVLRTVLDSSSEQRVLTKVTEPRLSEELIEALQENGFIWIENSWIKANLPVIDTTTELAAKLTAFSNQLPQASQYFQDLAKILNETQATSDNTQRLLDLEKSLWPAKMIDLNIPAFIVPIWADWAMQLFDFNIASQDLFGGEPSLLLNVENVYYRAASPSPKNLAAPARILWYVSKGKNHYQGGMSIRACSYLDEIVIDKPKPIFSRFRRLGVYQWSDVFKMAKENLDQEIMAFRFSHTEVFNNPIGKNELASLWQAETGDNFHIQMPIFIANQLFFRLYKMGTQTSPTK